MERNGPAFGDNGDALVYAGEAISVGFRLEQPDGAGWTGQDLAGREFALRVFGGGGVTPLNIGAAVTAHADGDYLAVTITGTQTAALLPALRESAQYRWSFDELVEGGFASQGGGDFRVRRTSNAEAPAEGAGGTVTSVYQLRVDQPIVKIRDQGAPGVSAYAFAVAAGYAGTEAEFGAALAAAAAELADVLAAIDAAGNAELDAIADAAAAVLEALGLAGDAELAALEQLGDALTDALTQLASDTAAQAAAAAASAALAATNAAYAGGVGYTFSTTTTDSDPGAGTIRYNNATPASVTFLYIDDLDIGGGTSSGWTDTFDDVQAAIRGQIYISQPGAATNAVFDVTGAVVVGSGYRKVPVVWRSGSAALPTAAARVNVLFTRTGVAAGGVALAFSTTTTDTDPGAGLVQFNNATLSSVTMLYIDNVEAGGGTITTWIDSFDDVNGGIRGQLLINEPASGKFALFNVTGAVVSGGGYRKVPVTFVSGSASNFSNGNRLLMQFAVAGSEAGIPFVFSTTTTDADPGAGGLRFNNATVASVTQIYADNTAAGGNSITGWLDTFDDADASVKGQIQIVEPGTAKFAVFDVIGGVADGTGYRKISVTYLAGVLPTNGARVLMTFARAGADADAADIAADPRIYSLAKAKFETEADRGDHAFVESAVLASGWTLTNVTLNDDGTFTGQVGGTMVSPQLTGDYAIAGNRYCYVPCFEGGAVSIGVEWNGSTIMATAASTTEPYPDVYKQTWTNSVPRAYARITVTFTAAGDCWKPEVVTTDSAYYPQVRRFNDVTLVPENRRIIDWNEISPMARWQVRDRGMWAADEAQITHAFDSVAGSDAAAGGRFAAKQNLTAGSAVAPGSVIGLKRSSVWNQAVNTMIGSTTKGLRIRDYQDGRVFDPWPILDAAIDVTGLTWASEGSDTYSATVPCATDMLSTGKLNYDYASVVEIELSRQADEPLGCQFIYEPVNIVLTGAVPAADQTVAINKVKAVAGRTLGVFTPGASSYTLYIHTRDGLSPAASPTYGYRATNLNSCMDFIQGNTRQGVVQNIEFRQGAKGLGIVCGSDQSVLDGIIACHGYKHTLHIEGGEVRNFLLYNRGAKEGIDSGANAGNCYVSPTANGFAWRWTNGLAIDCHSAIYSHAAGGKYTRGEISYVWTLNERDSTGSLAMGDPRDADQVAFVEEMWNFDRGKMTNGDSGADYTHFHHNLAQHIGWFQSRDLTEQSISQLENVSGAALGDRGMRLVRVSGDDEVTGNIFYGTNVQTTVGDANPTNDYRATCIELVNTGGDPLGNPNIHRNIFLVDTPLCTGGTVIVAEQASGFTWRSDYNVFIFRTPGNISSTKHGSGSKTTIAEYLTSFPGHDANSLFVDLRDDPRGAQAVFMDPTNGDFRWAQTEVAARIKAYCIANGVGPDWTTRQWPETPTVDEARILLMASA